MPEPLQWITLGVALADLVGVVVLALRRDPNVSL